MCCTYLCFFLLFPFFSFWNPVSPKLWWPQCFGRILRTGSSPPTWYMYHIIATSSRVGTSTWDASINSPLCRTEGSWINPEILLVRQLYRNWLVLFFRWKAAWRIVQFDQNSEKLFRSYFSWTTSGSAMARLVFNHGKFEFDNEVAKFCAIAIKAAPVSKLNIRAFGNWSFQHNLGQNWQLYVQHHWFCLEKIFRYRPL